MNKYEELKDKHGKLINDFPMFFAFNDEQFEEGKKRLGVTEDKELISIIGRGFIRKTDREKYKAMWKTIRKEDAEAKKDDEYLYQAFLYELANHEYIITYDYEETLTSLNLTYEELTEKQKGILLKATDEYLKRCEEME